MSNFNQAQASRGKKCVFQIVSVNLLYYNAFSIANNCLIIFDEAELSNSLEWSPNQSNIDSVVLSETPSSVWWIIWHIEIDDDRKLRNAEQKNSWLVCIIMKENNSTMSVQRANWLGAEKNGIMGVRAKFFHFRHIEEINQFMLFIFIAVAKYG